MSNGIPETFLLDYNILFDIAYRCFIKSNVIDLFLLLKKKTINLLNLLTNAMASFDICIDDI